MTRYVTAGCALIFFVFAAWERSIGGGEWQFSAFLALWFSTVMGWDRNE